MSLSRPGLGCAVSSSPAAKLVVANLSIVFSSHGSSKQGRSSHNITVSIDSRGSSTDLVQPPWATLQLQLSAHKCSHNAAPFRVWQQTPACCPDLAQPRCTDSLTWQWCNESAFTKWAKQQCSTEVRSSRATSYSTAAPKRQDPSRTARVAAPQRQGPCRAIEAAATQGQDPGSLIGAAAPQPLHTCPDLVQ